MRIPKYLSPSALAVAEENLTLYYINYLADNKPEKIPQTQPMSVGSSFDAYAKSYLYESLFGKNHNPKFEFKALFEAQVESINRDWALDAGKWAFEFYKKSGALADLVTELSTAIGPPSFEFEAMGVVNGYREGVTLDLDVVLFGKPDVRFVSKLGARIVYDFKVNGFCGSGNTSPKPRYIKVSDGWGPEFGHASRNNGERHKNCTVMSHHGFQIATHYLEDVDHQWATQLGTYGWLLGEKVGADFICGIDQLACAHSGIKDKPLIRVAQHRARISETFQMETLARYQRLWQLINSGHFFQELTIEESKARCEMLDKNELKIDENMSDNEKMAIRLMRDI